MFHIIKYVDLITDLPYWLCDVYNCAALFARALSACNIKDLINNVGSAAGAPAAAAGTAAAPVEETKKEDKKEEEKKEETDSEDEDMGFGKCLKIVQLIVMSKCSKFWIELISTIRFCP